MPTLPTVSRLCLKTILVPTDFSAASRAALPFVHALAETYGSNVLLAHVIAPEPHRQIVTERVPEEDRVVWDDARHKMDTFTDDRNLDGVSCTPLVDRGDIRDVISDIVDERKVDLVVLASHGRHGVSKMILGSDAEKIYRAATCPVLVIGPKVQAAKTWTVRQILCPVDTSEDPVPVLHYALSMAEEHQSKFILMQSIPLVPWQHQQDVDKRSRRALEALIPEQSKDWCSPEYVVRWDYPPVAIVSEAEKRQVDLIVMGVHKSRAMSTHLPWPVASEVIGQAHCPVLTIRV